MGLSTDNLVALLAARSILDQELEKAGPIAAGKYQLADAELLIHIAGVQVAKSADYTRANYAKIPWELGVAFLLGRLTGSERVKARAEMFTLFARAASEDGLPKKEQAALAKIAEDLKKRRQQLDDQTISGPCKVAAVGNSELVAPRPDDDILLEPAAAGETVTTTTDALAQTTQA